MTSLHSHLIRPVAEEDFEDWLVLWNGYNRFYGRAGETALAHEVTALSWLRFLVPDEAMFGLVAELDGKLVGLANYLFHRSTSSADVCYLQDLFTAEAARGSGVARALIERVYQEAKVAGAARVYWQTHKTNNSAQLLYDRIGEATGFIVYRHVL